MDDHDFHGAFDKIEGILFKEGRLLNRKGFKVSKRVYSVKSYAKLFF